MITVACVLRSGGDFVPLDVAQLASGVARNLSQPFRFKCLTDVVKDVQRLELEPDRVTIEPLAHDWPGWWSKLELFETVDDVVLCLDLDTIIVGDPSPIIEAVQGKGGLHMLQDFYRPHLLQSGIMAWTGDMFWPIEAFYEVLKHGAHFAPHSGALRLIDRGVTYRGDGEWLHHTAKALERNVSAIQDHVSGIYSYKVHVKDSGLPEDARLVCFHGKPRPRDVADERWVREHWTADNQIVGAAI